MILSLVAVTALACSGEFQRLAPTGRKVPQDILDFDRELDATTVRAIKRTRELAALFRTGNIPQSTIDGLEQVANEMEQGLKESRARTAAMLSPEGQAAIRQRAKAMADFREGLGLPPRRTVPRSAKPAADDK